MMQPATAQDEKIDVVITRPEDSGRELAKELNDMGYSSLLCPMLRIVPLTVELPDFEPYSALVFTSPHGVRTFSTLSNFRNLPVYTVGDATKQNAEKAGFKTVYSAEGNVEALIDLLESHFQKSGGALLYLCAQDVASDLPAVFAGSKIKIDQKAIYQAQLTSHLPDNVITALKKNTPKSVLFFSTRTAENFVRLINEHNLKKHCTSLRAICMSTSVAVAARELGCERIKVAQTPDKDALLDELSKDIDHAE